MQPIYAQPIWNVIAEKGKNIAATHQFTLCAEPPFDVAVIGAGASGVLLAAQFRRNAPVHSRLALIGADHSVGHGIAYGTPDPSHLLNVRAANMSAFPDDMDHFLRWLQRRDPDAHEKTFASRAVYGEYLADLLNVPSRGFASISRVTGTAIDLIRINDVWFIQLNDGSTVLAHNVVLALGNQLPDDVLPQCENLGASYLRNPWSLDLALDVPSHTPVLLIGTGQSMVDVVMSLRQHGYQGDIHAISRHGWLPQEHSDFVRRPMQKLPAGLHSPLDVLHWLRKEIALGADWRTVLDSLRPHTAAIWRGWSLAQRASFLRHARSLWNVHRHRIAPVVYQQLQGLIAQGVLSIHRGKVIGLSRSAQGLTVHWQAADGSGVHELEAARVINCTGPSRDYSRIDHPLIVSLRQSGWLVPDALRLGVETDMDGHLLAVDGFPVDGLFAVGPLRIPMIWESVAIPEIRLQAAALVKLLVSNIIRIPISIISI